MTQPLGNCPGCGGDEPFERVHAVDQCPDADGECLEWLCTGCGAGVFMGAVPSADVGGLPGAARPVRPLQSVRAA